MTTSEQVWTNQAKAPPKRDLKQAMWRGFRCRCPNCGEGKLFRAYLKTNDAARSAARICIITAPMICPPIS